MLGIVVNLECTFLAVFCQNTQPRSTVKTVLLLALVGETILFPDADETASGMWQMSLQASGKHKNKNAKRPPQKAIAFSFPTKAILDVQKRL